MLKKIFVFLIVAFLVGCKNTVEDPFIWKTIEVTATAYNSTVAQTDGNPHITAWGDSLKPGMPYIAVSRDLVKKGLTHNTPVKIEGLVGTYLVKDKMHYRWRNKIDIYMGKDVKAAKAWGRKKVEIKYGIIDTVRVKNQLLF
ncbi:hypothetical protein EGM88_12310 [Aureibaculum marinum]|uniref:3D domain-containing protein n=1 Tax=Aureibaculum marinum TaxID=2487930 RepID=A0A3N4NGH1_9FLAO|nr:3D domain-containing protein [Aureibaculum marinum]RPD94515.1 hypothetical protein EGM88_12310 [Aureibaculum marinum]